MIARCWTEIPSPWPVLQLSDASETDEDLGGYLAAGLAIPLSVSPSASPSASRSVHSPDSGDLESGVWLRVGQGAYPPPTQPVPGHQAPQGAVGSAIGPRVPLSPTSWNALAWSRAGRQAARSFVHAVLCRDAGASLRHRCRGLDREQPRAAARAAAGSAICAIPLSIYRVVGQSASQQVCLSVYFDARPFRFARFIPLPQNPRLPHTSGVPLSVSQSVGPLQILAPGVEYAVLGQQLVRPGG